MVHSLKAYINASGKPSCYPLIHDVKRCLADSKAASGFVNILSTNSTTSIVLLENDENIRRELLEYAQSVFAGREAKAVSRRSGTGADPFHLMAALTGLSLTLPFAQGRLLIHPQQEVFALDYEPKPGRREFVISVLPMAAPPQQGGPGPR